MCSPDGQTDVATYDTLTVIAATACLRLLVRPNLEKELTAFDLDQGARLLEILQDLGVELRPIDDDLDSAGSLKPTARAIDGA
jgi:hypothetical protein